MKIKLKTCLAGADFTRNSGEIIEVSEAEAVRFLEAGLAEALPDVTAIETATAPQAKIETATVKQTAAPKPAPTPAPAVKAK